MMPSDKTFPVPLVHIPETSSTNSYLQALCSQQKVTEFTTILADFQTAGRGQRGNSWESDKEKNLLFSLVLFPDFLEARHQFLVSQIISLAIKEELDSYTPGISIKWPNDIYWNNQKICGMLIENELMGTSICQSIAGIGININQESFQSPAPNPVSLLQITGKSHDRLQILHNILTHIKAYYKLLQQGQTKLITLRYKESLYRKEGSHLYKDSKGIFSAQFIRIESNGTLVLKDDLEIERKYLFKEIEYVLQ